VLSEPAKFGRAAAFLAEDNGKVVGFGACSGQRDQALKEQGFEGEINAIYVLRSHQCLGAGRSLMRLMARTLMDQGRSAAALWVLRENARARHFYERLGGALAGEKVEEKAGVLLPEVAYGWSDLTRMADWTRS
jgi:ribosomal protein S18 acetylase RimI-like enzyme